MFFGFKIWYYKISKHTELGKRSIVRSRPKMRKVGGRSHGHTHASLLFKNAIKKFIQASINVKIVNQKCIMKIKRALERGKIVNLKRG